METKNIQKKNGMINRSGLVAFILMIVIVFSGCKHEEFDSPPHDRPQYTGGSNITLQQFKAKYDQNLVEITGEDVITGVVTANDISGNLYMQLFIEDETGGLLITINQNNLHNDYRVGQKIYVETHGLFMGKYGGFQQLGYRYSPNNDGNYTIGRMPWELAKSVIFKEDYPNPDEVVPQKITYNEFMAENYGRLVTLEGVYFEDAGQIFSVPTQEGGVQTLNRIIRFASDETKTITGRMSSAANFASDTIPSGIGSVTGVLTVFNNTVQLLVRDIHDINFEENPYGWGLENDPWLVEYALANQDEGKTGWVTGYIVGTIQPGINDNNPISSNDDLDFESSFDVNNYIVIAQSPDETNWENCLVVNLPLGSPMRSLLNLRDNESNLGEEVAVKGTLESILGASGIRVASGLESEFKFGAAGEEILHVPFENTLEPFTTYSVTGAQQWAIDAQYNYAIMSGYVSATQTRYENEDWLISPGLDLSEYQAAHITFEHISRYGNNSEDLTLWISSDYTGGSPVTATWTQIPINHYSSGGSWYDWANSGKLNIPSEFTGEENVRIAFKYLSTDSRAATWQIIDLYVKSGLGVEGDDPGPDDDNFNDPLSIADARVNQNMNLYTWVEGYVVGVVNQGVSVVNSSADVTFNAPFPNTTNVILADDADETDYNNCIIVNLPAGSVLRSSVNLQDNPGNQGKTLKIYGNLRNYFGIPGLRDVEGDASSFVLSGEGSDPGDPTDVQGDGSQQNPYNITAIRANQGATGSHWAKGYIVGTVDGLSYANDANFSDPFESHTNLLIAASPGETNHANCIPVQLPAGNVRNILNLRDNPGNKGKEVLLYGELLAYFGVDGLRSVSNFVLNGASNDPDEPDGTILLSVSFASELAPFTNYSVTGEQNWFIDTQYTCAKMTGYDGEAKVNENWLISPSIDLSGITELKIIFEHALNYATDMNQYTLWISENYTNGDPGSANWTQLTIPNYPPGTNWDFISSGEIIVPAQFEGVNNIHIAFKYVSTTSEAGTWEIKNLFVYH